MGKYVVFDLEMCRVPRCEAQDTFQGSNELIQIGAVELNEHYEIVRTFVTHVKPEFGVIDERIQRLTGITQEDVKNAPLAKDALACFLKWLPDDGKLVAWSENDVNQIDDELYFKDIDLPEFYELLDHYLDCQEMFSEKMHTSKRYNLREALSIANIEYDENIHDALVDAKNTALLFAKIQTEEKLHLSPYYMTQDDLMSYQGRFTYS